MNTLPTLKREVTCRQCCRFGEEVDVPIPCASVARRFPMVVAYAWRMQRGWFFIHLSGVSPRVDGTLVPRGGHVPLTSGSMVVMSGRRFRIGFDEDGSIRVHIVWLERVALELRDEELLPVEGPESVSEVSGVRRRLDTPAFPERARPQEAG